MIDGHPQRSSRPLPPCAAPPLRPLPFPPPPRLPHAPPAPPHAAPLARPSPLRAALPRRYADPRSASRRSGIAAPASATAPPLTRLGAACARGLAILAPPSRLGVHGWARVELARGRSLASASGVALGKRLGVKIGGVLRGVLPRSSALRASGGGARGDAVRGSPPRAQPRLRSALRLRLRLRASFKSAETADFQRRLSVRAFPGHFSGSFRRFGG